MTNKNSPLSELKRQADTVAKVIKAAERGEAIDVRFAERIAAARLTDSFVIGIVMDDKTIKMTLPWSMIQKSGEVALSEWILREMRELRSN